MEQQKITITMPLFIQLDKKQQGKKYYINLNHYRNWHYMVNNNLKKKYAELLHEKLPNDIVFKNPIELTFILWKKDKRRIDRANPLSIHEKFFCDALVTYGAIPDDNDNFIVATHYYTGGIDKKNPRVEIIVHETIS